MGKIYNEKGNLTDARVAELGGEISDKVAALIDELASDGMTILEGRAVNDYLKSQIDISVTIALMQQQCKL